MPLKVNTAMEFLFFHMVLDDSFNPSLPANSKNLHGTQVLNYLSAGLDFIYTDL
jgi:hypothetical protein